MTIPVITEAVLSPDKVYRYHLTRVWDTTRPRALLVMINPSIATADVNDPTIIRCVGFGRRDGFGGIEVVNAYAIIATDIQVARRAANAVGPLNDQAINVAANEVTAGGWKIIVAWGAKPWARDRLRVVRRILEPFPLWCLGVTKDGSPRHPLMVRLDQPLITWPTTRMRSRPGSPMVT